MQRSSLRSAIGASTVALAALLTGCFPKPVKNPGAAPAHWYMLQHDAAHTGFVAGSLGPKPVLAWKTYLDSTTRLTPPVFGAIRDTFRARVSGRTPAPPR